MIAKHLSIILLNSSKALILDSLFIQTNDSPRIFVINLPEADTARTFCAEIINRAFRYRKNSFTLQPKIAFIFDEAQEFIRCDKKKEDGTDYSSRAVEKLLRHGRKLAWMDIYSKDCASQYECTSATS
jgi:hypothetical protein